MTELEKEIASAAAAGVAEAGAQFARALEAAGETAAVHIAPDGSASVVIEGAGAREREFGTRWVSARPFLAPALQENRAAMLSVISRRIADVLRRRT